MFALIRNLIGRPYRNTSRHSGSLMTSSLAAKPTLPGDRVVSTNPTPCPTPKPVPATAAPLENQNGETLSLPLAPIVARFSEELKAAMIARPSDTATVTLPLALVVQQLSTGTVRLPLGYLRQTSSEHCFASTQQFDAMPVVLPLDEVLSHISPAQLPRRTRQSVTVPDSVAAPFSSPAPTNIVAPPTPEPQMIETVPVEQEAPVAEPIVEMTPAPAPEAYRISMLPGALPKTAAAASAPIRINLPARTPAVPAAVPAPAPAPAAHITVTAPAGSSTSPIASPAAATQVAPQPAGTFSVPQTAQRRNETSFFRAGCLTLPLNRLATGWPAAVLQEVANQNLASASVELPVEEVEAGLKQGRLAFTWRQIRAWTTAVSKPLSESVLDSTALELPLRFVAPLFLSQRPMAQRQRPAIGEGIPNIFGPGSLAFETSTFQKVEEEKPAAAQAPMTGSKPAADPWETQFEGFAEAAQRLPKLEAALPKPEAPAPAAPVAPSSAQTSFQRRTVDVILGDPGKDNWSPMEIVRKISRMRTVAGATISTQDGLLVAEQYPALVGVDTFCALTTQMFNRVFSTAMELRLGGPARISVVAESVTYEIYRCGRLFLTVVSQPGEKLPSHDLIVIADHLTNQSR